MVYVGDFTVRKQIFRDNPCTLLTLMTLKLNFLGQFWIFSKFEGRYEDRSNSCLIQAELSTFPSSVVHCATTDKSTLTDHYHTKSIVILRITIFVVCYVGFGWMYNAICPVDSTTQYIFYHSQNALCSYYSSLSTNLTWKS